MGVKLRLPGMLCGCRHLPSLRVAHEYFYDKDPVVAVIGDTDNLPEYDSLRAVTFQVDL